MDNINAYSTDRLNNKFSLINVVITFFIILHVFIFSLEGYASPHLNKKATPTDEFRISNDYIYMSKRGDLVKAKQNLMGEHGDNMDYMRPQNTSEDSILGMDKDILDDQEDSKEKIKRMLRIAAAESDQYRKNISNFFTNMSLFIYEGRWVSKLGLNKFEKKEGDIRYHMNLNLNQLFANETYITAGMRFLDGDYMDNWYFIRIWKCFSSIFDEKLKIFDFKTNTLQCTNFDINIIQGQFFDKVGETYECKGNMTLNWDYKIDNSISNENFNNKVLINKMRGSISTDKLCDVYLEDFRFSMEIEDSEKDNIYFVLYSIMVTALCFSQIFGTIWLNQKTNDSFSNSNAISLFTIGQNIIWNAYGCLCHFFLAVNNEQHVAHFGIPAFLFFTNFSIFELRLLYNVWKNQNIAELNDINVVRKKLVKFYITFYVMLFLSLFFVTKFYFDPVYIGIAFGVTWLPQIIHNVIYKNYTSIPLINIILNTINKGLIPLYFRGCPKNIFHVKCDFQLVYILSIILLSEFVILYLQALCGPRFFIPCKFAASDHKYYRDKEELIQAKNEFENAECTICLLPLIASAEDERKRAAENNQEQDEYFEENRNGRRGSNCAKCITRFLQKLYQILFDFHEYHFFANKKPFILTPCNHAFHSRCLEDWLKQKRECPTDRTFIPPIES